MPSPQKCENQWWIQFLSVRNTISGVQRRKGKLRWMIEIRFFFAIHVFHHITICYQVFDTTFIHRSTSGWHRDTSSWKGSLMVRQKVWGGVIHLYVWVIWRVHVAQWIVYWLIVVRALRCFKSLEWNHYINVLCCVNWIYRLWISWTKISWSISWTAVLFFPKKGQWRQPLDSHIWGLHGAPNGWLPFQTCTKWQGSLGVKQWRVSLRWVTHPVCWNSDVSPH